MRRECLFVRRRSVPEEVALVRAHLEEAEVLTVLRGVDSRDSHQATESASRQYDPKTLQIAARGGSDARRPSAREPSLAVRATVFVSCRTRASPEQDRAATSRARERGASDASGRSGGCRDTCARP